MAAQDFSPLFRTIVGFDRISNLIEQANRLEGAPGYPPFNIEQVGDDQFRIEIAVAGFTDDDLSIEFKQNTLTVTGRKPALEEAGRRYLHRGIAERNFERRFGLADHVRVVAANLEHGLLTIQLERELPETLKPRRIEIGATAKVAPQQKAVNDAA